MAKFLTTVGNSFYIEQIIIKAEKDLTLVTPYLNLSKNFIERLSDANKKGIRITLIYGKNELKRTEKQKIENLENIEIYFCENLHAKCYHNENDLIITSMNLYEFSERNNREMGLLIEKATDQEIFEETLAEIESIKNASIKEKEFIVIKSNKGTLEKKGVNEINLVKENKEIERISNKLNIHPDFQNINDFHLPALSKILKKKYPRYSVVLTDFITINNFPNNNVDLVISGIIDFTFKNDRYFDHIKYTSKQSLREHLPGIRLYWNCPKLNIYGDKRFKVEVNDTGLKAKVDKFMTTIDTVYNELNKE